MTTVTDPVKKALLLAMLQDCADAQAKLWGSTGMFERNLFPGKDISDRSSDNLVQAIQDLADQVVTMKDLEELLTKLRPA